MFDKNGKLTREGAEQAIRAGGSVLINGKLIGRIEDLPKGLSRAGNDRQNSQQTGNQAGGQDGD